MKLGTNAHVPQRMNPTDFAYALTFSATMRLTFWVLSEILFDGLP